LIKTRYVKRFHVLSIFGLTAEAAVQRSHASTLQTPGYNVRH
jgi:hypothetical protein